MAQRFGSDSDETAIPSQRFGADSDTAVGGPGPRASNQQSTVAAHQPTRFDRFVTGVTGDVMRPPDASGDMVSRVVNGVGSNLGRTMQAWHDMFTGNANPTTLAEMVPGVGPAAVDAGRMLATPGQRTEGAGAAMALLFPAVDNGIGVATDIGGRAIRPVASAARAITSPEVMSEIPGGKIFNRVSDAFVNKYRQLNAPAKPPTVFSVNQDVRPMNGPERPPVAVVRDANSPAWASHPTPAPAAVPEFEPIRNAALPSGRVGPASVSQINPPPPPSMPPRSALWRRAGTDVSPSVPSAPVDPIYPSGGVMPSGRIIGPLTPSSGGRIPAPQSPQPTPGVPAQLPAAPVAITPSGVARIGTTPAEAIQGLSRSSEGTMGTRAEMMRQLRLADQNGTTDAGKAAIIKRFEAPEYTPRTIGEK